MGRSGAFHAHDAREAEAAEMFDGVVCRDVQRQWINAFGVVVMG